MDLSRCGINFSTLDMNVYTDPWVDMAVQITSAITDPCNPYIIAPTGIILSAMGVYKQKELNVFYLPLSIRGKHCTTDKNVIIIGKGADPQTLAHEIGHAFDLKHVAIPPFIASNIMNGGATGRDHFTEGQCFHMSVDQRSQLRQNDDRMDPPEYDCTADNCIPLEFDQ